MTKLQFITYSLGVLALGMIYSYCFMNKHEEQEALRSKTKHYETRYGDTMLVTVDTTYFYKK